MNILIKLTCLIGLVIAPILGGHTSEGHDDTSSNEIRKEVKVEMTAVNSEDAKAVVTMTTSENGATITEEKVIEGTEAEVKAKLEALENVEVIIEETEKTKEN